MIPASISLAFLMLLALELVDQAFRTKKIIKNNNKIKNWLCHVCVLNWNILDNFFYHNLRVCDTIKTQKRMNKKYLIHPSNTYK